jgi:hypothetical protein
VKHRTISLDVEAVDDRIMVLPYKNPSGSKRALFTVSGAKDEDYVIRGLSTSKFTW